MQTLRTSKIAPGGVVELMKFSDHITCVRYLRDHVATILHLGHEEFAVYLVGRTRSFFRFHNWDEMLAWIDDCI